MSPVEVLSDADILDNPERWFGMSLETLVDYRMQLIRSSKPIHIKDASNPTNELQKIQELAMASQKLDVEVELTKAPSAFLSFSDASPPMGPSAPLKQFDLQENPFIPKKVERLVSDTDVKSATAIEELYSGKTPVHHLYKLLSAGTLGVKDNRKFVPTRWSITAVDSTVGNQLIDKVKSFSQINDFQLFESHFLDNHFFVLLIPREWSFDIMEAYRPGGFWSKDLIEVHMSCDHEFYDGRKDYAENVAGGYYASRLAVLEHLNEIRRQSACVIFREIGSGYQQPMGVWVPRQIVRNALETGSMNFDSIDASIKHLSTKLVVPIKEWEMNSKLLDRARHQRRLLDFASMGGSSYL